MSAERFAREARAAIVELSTGGALARTKEHRAVFRSLSAAARGLGLMDLAGRLADVATALEGQAALGHAPNARLAEALLAAYDRVEALSAMLAGAELLRAFGADPLEEEAP
jgi:hypothetical protein